MADFASLLQTLAGHEVGFVVIGGFAAIAHGSAFLTVDLDVVYDRSPENLDRLSRALAPLSPYLRGVPAGLPFRLDADTLSRGLNFTLTTSAGDLDLLGEAAGGGTYDAILPHSEERDVFGCACRFVDLDTLIRLKRAAGRPPRTSSGLLSSKPFAPSAIPVSDINPSTGAPMKPTRMVIAALTLGLVLGSAAASSAQAPAAAAAKPASTSSLALLAKDLPNIEGKEVTMSEITYPPGFASAPHRHDANTFVYVLQGTMQMQVGGGEVLTLKAGQTFYESPTDVHATSRNASATEPAKILVFMLKDKGKPASRPAN